MFRCILEEVWKRVANYDKKKLEMISEKINEFFKNKITKGLLRDSCWEYPNCV